MKEMICEEIVPGGSHWSGLMRRGSALRLTDLGGGATFFDNLVEVAGEAAEDFAQSSR